MDGRGFFPHIICVMSLRPVGCPVPWRLATPSGVLGAPVVVGFGVPGVTLPNIVRDKSLNENPYIFVPS
jgi:hypothetical protein